MPATATSPLTLAGLLREAVPRLRAAGVPDPGTDARLLLCAAVGIAREDLLRAPEMPVDEAAAVRFRGFAERRARREPVAHILGRREFHGLDLEVTADTLDPRPDSETLVDAVLVRARARGGAVRILDLGTGTGCLLLSLLHDLPAATGVGVDVSAAACAVAARNARRLGLAARCDIVNADWKEIGIADRFDVVISNPPYIEAGVLPTLQPEVARFEPRVALDGGSDGLDAYRAFAGALPDVLAEDGAAFLEIGAGQEEAVSKVLAAAGFAPRGRYLDLAGYMRVLAFGR